MLILLHEGDQNFLDRHLAPCLLSPRYSPPTPPPVHPSTPLPPVHIPLPSLFPFPCPSFPPSPFPACPLSTYSTPLSLTGDICTQRRTHKRQRLRMQRITTDGSEHGHECERMRKNQGNNPPPPPFPHHDCTLPSLIGGELSNTWAK